MITLTYAVMIEDRTNSPEWGELKPWTKKELLTECEKEVKYTAELESEWKFIREKTSLHRESMVSSQRERVRGIQRDKDNRGTEQKAVRKTEKDTERDWQKTLRGTLSAWGIQFV